MLLSQDLHDDLTPTPDEHYPESVQSLIYYGGSTVEDNIVSSDEPSQNTAFIDAYIQRAKHYKKAIRRRSPRSTCSTATGRLLQLATSAVMISGEPEGVVNNNKLSSWPDSQQNTIALPTHPHKSPLSFFRQQRSPGAVPEKQLLIHPKILSKHMLVRFPLCPTTGVIVWRYIQKLVRLLKHCKTLVSGIRSSLMVRVSQ